MHIRLRGIFWVIFFIAFWHASVDATDLPVGTITTITGKVLILREGQSLVAEKAVRIFERDIIQTGKMSRLFN